MWSDQDGSRFRTRVLDWTSDRVYSLWEAVFYLAGYLPQTRSVIPSGERNRTERVMVLAPHPDDELIGCGGALIEHVANGDRICLVHLTDGRRSRALNLAPDELSFMRRSESQQVARSLAVQRHEFIGLPEGRWNPRELDSVLSHLLNEFPPHLLYAPSRVDYHPEHISVAHTLADTIQAHPSWENRFVIRIYPVHVPLTPVLGNVLIPVGRVIPQLRRLLNLYKSQMLSLGMALRHRNYTARLHHTSSPLEEYWELRPSQYRKLHQSSLTHEGIPFRGLRYRPWGDLLAYSHGMSMRKKLRQLVYDVA